MCCEVVQNRPREVRCGRLPAISVVQLPCCSWMKHDTVCGSSQRAEGELSRRPGAIGSESRPPCLGQLLKSGGRLASASGSFYALAYPSMPHRNAPAKDTL